MTQSGRSRPRFLLAVDETVEAISTQPLRFPPIALGQEP
jgi:hypothetical protein